MSYVLKVCPEKQNKTKTKNKTVCPKRPRLCVKHLLHKDEGLSSSPGTHTKAGCRSMALMFAPVMIWEVKTRPSNTSMLSLKYAYITRTHTQINKKNFIHFPQDWTPSPQSSQFHIRFPIWHHLETRSGTDLHYLSLQKNTGMFP